jgi:hypothetical protein
MIIMPRNDCMSIIKLAQLIIRKFSMTVCCLLKSFDFKGSRDPHPRPAGGPTNRICFTKYQMQITKIFAEI